MKYAEEPVCGIAVAPEGVVPATARGRDEFEGVEMHAVRTEPAGVQIGLGVCAEDGRGRCVELTHDVDEWQARLGRDGGRIRHGCTLSSVSGMCSSRVSRRR